jgi:hypothetical protein
LPPTDSGLEAKRLRPLPVPVRAKAPLRPGDPQTPRFPALRRSFKRAQDRTRPFGPSPFQAPGFCLIAKIWGAEKWWSLPKARIALGGAGRGPQPVWHDARPRCPQAHHAGPSARNRFTVTCVTAFPAWISDVKKSPCANG